MAISRTDEQRILQAPLALIFGGQERSVAPLPHRRAREWRSAFQEAVTKLGRADGLSLSFLDESGKVSMDQIAQTLRVAAVVIPDELADVVFLYLRLADPSISREWFDETATTGEITDALPLLIEVEFPFLRKIGKFFPEMGPASSSATSPSSRGTNGA